MLIDRIRLKQVITNLVKNAATYSPEDSPIKLEGRICKEHFEVSVTDHGDGIASQHLEKIFEPFYRVTLTDRRRWGGMGLGVSLCRGIIEAHGATIWVESKLGEGSKLTFALPISSAE